MEANNQDMQMKSNSRNSGKQKVQHRKQDDNRPSTDLQDAALDFILKLRKSDPIRYERPKVTLFEKRG